VSTPATPLSYVVTASVRSGGEASAVAHGATIPFDGTRGRVDGLPGPADLLAAALSACILKNVERFSHLLPFRYESASVRVVADRTEPPPKIVRIRYELRVVTDEAPVRVELLHKNIRKFGTITNTLAAACDLDGTIVAVASDEGERPSRA
jgi:uncharacterized OsmC-like protein